MYELAAGRGGDALHLGAHRLGQGGDGGHQPAALLEDRLEEVPVARVRAQLLQVVAGAEAAPGALDDDHADRLVGRDAIERLLQRAHESAGEGVVLTGPVRSEEHTSELQSLMRISYAVFRLNTNKSTPLD